MRTVIKRNAHIRSEGSDLWRSLKQARYFYLSIAALLLSAYFASAEKQFIVLALIAGAKWIMADGINRINILITERR
jgi:hypothetical protein